MKVIKERKEFHISIKDVIFASVKTRFSNSVIPLRIRASKGTEVHQLFQKDRKKTEKSFQSEVLVKFQTEIQGWKFIISGRVDIIYESKGILVVEEIKSIMCKEYDDPEAIFEKTAEYFGLNIKFKYNDGTETIKELSENAKTIELDLQWNNPNQENLNDY